MEKETNEIVQEVWIQARPETVFSFYTDPEKMKRWMGIEVELDPRPGGIYRVNVDGKHIESGEFTEVLPPSRIVHAFGWEEGNLLPAGSSRVEITFTPEGDGTRVRVRQTGLPKSLRKDHEEGWKHYLPRLTAVAEGRDPGRDPWAEGA
ncbi:uncharacterized protein YndB with AHSA1/START domain [Melghirimyces profundicolus]|uniref:Uncharacterized protein YndB with AHSA1/START domain n=1 Tax=Melghirimyces profundicolus TaxID=1242148 RepID=A0A2T6BUA3_9BACL|nr:SRPBCC domain-containing protein [Melghirimyces profundicolus]PTX59660.1 uncharacterized protein YndB with AHSA1/START domain [Melghirimyces profundicolus]